MKQSALACLLGMVASCVTQYAEPGVNQSSAEQECPDYDPILIDVAGDGVKLSDVIHGVTFDIGRGTKRVAWTLAGSDDAWLAIDVNGNGTIDGAAELFGDHSSWLADLSQKGGGGAGFRALAVLDANADGVVDAADPAFGDLILWADLNHDGVSQPNELTPFSSQFVSIGAIGSPDGQYTDAAGNFLAASALAKRSSDKPGTLAWDVVATSEIQEGPISQQTMCDTGGGGGGGGGGGTPITYSCECYGTLTPFGAVHYQPQICGGDFIRLDGVSVFHGVSTSIDVAFAQCHYTRDHFNQLTYGLVYQNGLCYGLPDPIARIPCTVGP